MPGKTPPRRKTTDLLQEVNAADLSDCGWIFERFVQFARERAARYVAVKPLARGYTSDAVQISLVQAAHCIKGKSISHEWRTSSGFHALLSVILLRRLIDFTRQQARSVNSGFNSVQFDQEIIPDPVDEEAKEEIRRLATDAAVAVFEQLSEVRQMVAYLGIIENWKGAEVEQWLNRYLSAQPVNTEKPQKSVKLRSIQVWIRNARKAMITQVVAGLKESDPDFQLPLDVGCEFDSTIIDRNSLPPSLSEAFRKINDDNDATA